MAREFEIRREVELPATPEQVFEAITAATDAWLFPTGEVEPFEGGKAAHGATVTAWDPPRHFCARFEGEDGFFNALEHVIEARDGGTAFLRYVHSGVFVEDWDNQYDAADKHTDFYLHTLRQYLQHFAGRPVTYVGQAPEGVAGPPASTTPGSFDRLRRELGVTDGVAEGDALQVELPGVGPQDAVVDYLAPTFVGLRTADGLYRFFGRDAWGAPVGMSAHLFSEGVDAEKVEQAWRDWLNGVYAGSAV